MKEFSILFTLCIAGLTFVAGYIYRYEWRKIYGQEVTPRGFGLLLAFVLLGAAIFAGVSLEIQVSIFVIAVAAIGYWFDDIIGLSAHSRILISFIVGVTIVSAFENWRGLHSLLFIFGICAVGGGINVVLTSVINFYDGADLNLATLIVLTAFFLLMFLPANSEWFTIAVALLAFVIPFAVMNSRPRNIYLGDAGCFVFASLVTVMIVAFFKDIRAIPYEAAIPIALPAFDVFFVLVIRIREKHDLLTRNYLHLYQRLNWRYNGFGYLLPQIINALLCLVFARILQATGLEVAHSVILALGAVTIPFYFACRCLFLKSRSDVCQAP